jgi:hypothetical protein
MKEMASMGILSIIPSLLAIVLGYEVDDKIDQAIFLAGASYENLLFEKKDKKSEEVKSNEI